jgi:hypothetical protein
MPPPEPPPRLTASSADVHAGVPEAATPDPVAAAAAAAALLPEAPAPEELDDEMAETAVAVDEDEVNPTVSAPAASSGMASRAFFIRSPNAWRTDGASMSFMTD